MSTSWASSQPGEAGGLLTDLVLAQARTQGSYARGSANPPQCGPLRVGDRDIWHIVEAMLNTSRDGETYAWVCCRISPYSVGSGCSARFSRCVRIYERFFESDLATAILPVPHI
jgi:hypothetical protein